MFDNSSIQARIEGGVVNGIMIGDGGHPCMKYLLTPVLCPTSRAEEEYNRVHTKARNIVERAIELKLPEPKTDIEQKEEVENVLLPLTHGNAGNARELFILQHFLCCPYVRSSTCSRSRMQYNFFHLGLLTNMRKYFSIVMETGGGGVNCTLSTAKDQTSGCERYLNVSRCLRKILEDRLVDAQKEIKWEEEGFIGRDYGSTAGDVGRGREGGYDDTVWYHQALKVLL
ncbi:hypothetical protein J437_LFUL005504, partial [Ladona fulva]